MPARWQDYAMEIDKQMLREKLLRNRPRSSEGLTEQLSKLLDLIDVRTIASYSPMEDEPNVSEFNRSIADSRLLLFPKVVSDNLIFCQGPLTQGRFGIMEPAGEETAGIELMIIPALAVDQKGNRLGRGRGFYDRYLLGRDTKRYAVVFDEEVLGQLPTDPWDQKIDGYVTPTRLVTF